MQLSNRIQWVSRFVALVSLVFACQAVADDYTDTDLYIEQIKTEFPQYDYKKFKKADTISLSIYHPSPSFLEKRWREFGFSTNAVRSKYIQVTVPKLAISQSNATIYKEGSYVDSTFVLDYEEDSVQSLLKEFEAENSPVNSIKNTARFIDNWIPLKDRSRGFDVASQVAENKIGDCTEHAVLLGATSRAIGNPARVVLGLVIIGTEQQAMSFGHAWTEIYADGRWQLADAALRGLEEPAFYVPFGVLENEGPGYSMGLFESIAALPTKLVLEPI